MLGLRRARIETEVRRLPWPFPEWAHAVTIWPFIFYERDVWDDECVQVHERYHWDEQLKWLIIPWFIAYGVLSLVYGGGRRHPMELEAYRRQDSCRANKETPRGS